MTAASPAALDETAARVLLRDRGLPAGGRSAHLILRWSQGNPAALLVLGRALSPPIGRTPAPPGSLITRRAGAFATLPRPVRVALPRLAARLGGEPDEVTCRILGADHPRVLAPAVEAGILTPALRFVDPVLALAAYLSAPAHARAAAHRAFAVALPPGSGLAARHAAEAATAPDEAVAVALEQTARQDHAAGLLGAATYAAHRSAELSPGRPDAARRYELALAYATRAGDDTWVRELIEEARSRPRCGANLDLLVAEALSQSRAGHQIEAMCTLWRVTPDPGDRPNPGRAWRADAAAVHVARQTGQPEHAPTRPDTAPWDLAETDSAPRRINELIDAGRWDEADAAASEVNARAHGYGLTVLGVQATALAATLTALRGNGQAARAQAESAWPVLELHTNAASHALLLRALGHAAIADHNWGIALAHFEALGQLQEARPALAPVEPDLALWITLSAIRASDPQHARELLKRLSTCHSTAAGPRLRLAYIEASALLAVDDEEAERHHQAAVTTPGANRWPFLLAVAQLNYGSWLRRRRRLVQARDQLAAALTAFEALCAEGYAAATRTELNAAGPPRGANGRPLPGCLTPQQREVATLAAQGLSNRLIADRMQITQRTVSTHLHSTFLKLGVSRRHLLTAALAGDLNQ